MPIMGIQRDLPPCDKGDNLCHNEHIFIGGCYLIMAILLLCGAYNLGRKK